MHFSLHRVDLGGTAPPSDTGPRAGFRAVELFSGPCSRFVLSLLGCMGSLTSNAPTAIVFVSLVGTVHCLLVPQVRLSLGPMAIVAEHLTFSDFV